MNDRVINGRNLINVKTMKFKLLTVLFFTLIIFAGCSQDELGTAPVPENYKQSIADWQEYRIGVLTDSTGWLRIKDLIWLDEEENSFGSGDDRDIQFHEGSIPEYAGTFTLNDGTVMMNVADGVEITYQGDSVREFEIFDGENRPRVEHESLIWFVDTRGDEHGIRIYDRDTPKRMLLQGFRLMNSILTGICRADLFRILMEKQFLL